MTVKERICNLVEDLPESDLLVAERMLRGLKLPPETEAPLPGLTREERRARIRAVRGILAHTHTSVDAFLARKREDVEREEARRGTA